MKLAIIFALTLISTGAFAKARVFCKADGKIIDVISKYTFECQSQLYTGDVCFTGIAKDAADILNSDWVRVVFDGTDGEYIKGARVKDADTITYTAMDEANEWSSKVTIKRCLGSWFRN